METTIVLMPPPAADEPDELRRRGASADDDEQVLTSEGGAGATSAPTTPSRPHALAAGGAVPGCFSSRSACVEGTGNCSSHGQCEDRWAGAGDASCFSCHCLMTEVEGAGGRRSVYHWGGPTCARRDVSTPFWLLAGTSLALVAAVAFAISLLFRVGEEKLPGVIGAGVSRSK